MKPRNIPNDKSNIEKEEKSWRQHSSSFQNILQSKGDGISIKTETQIHGTEQKAQKQIHAYMVNYFMTKGPKICNGERIVSLIHGVGEIEQPYAKE